MTFDEFFKLITILSKYIKLLDQIDEYVKVSQVASNVLYSENYRLLCSKLVDVRNELDDQCRILLTCTTNSEILKILDTIMSSKDNTVNTMRTLYNRLTTINCI